MSQTPSPQVVAIITMLIEERTGVRYAGADAPLITDKLVVRALEAGFESLLDYYYYLRYDAASASEFETLVDSLVVNETYFFREYDQLRVVVDELSVPSDGRAMKRVWSAACSTGEEPFTIAMMLANRGALNRVEIHATDISDRALGRARGGVFSRRALRSGSTPVEAEHWIQIVDGVPRLSSQIRQAVRFGKLNLLDKDAIGRLGMFDVILCRNVLIYFSDETILRVVSHLAQALRPDGMLVLGTSESLLRFGTTLTCEEHKGVFLYRKRR